MNITEKQKQQLIDLNDSRVNEILGLELKVGEWYKVKDVNTDWLMCYKGNKRGYGFNTNKIWSVDYFMGSERWIKATEQEVGQALVCFLQKKLLLY